MAIDRMARANSKKQMAAAKSPPQPPLNVATPPDLQNRFTFLIHKLNARLAQISNQLFQDYGLNAYSARILVLLLEYKELRVGMLVEIMAIPQSTVSHQLQRLEKQKIIRRRRRHEDNRSVKVTLTPLGHEIAEECNKLSLEVQNGIVGNLSKADFNRLSRLLPQLYLALNRFCSAREAGG